MHGGLLLLFLLVSCARQTREVRVLLSPSFMPHTDSGPARERPKDANLKTSIVELKDTGNMCEKERER